MGNLVIGKQSETVKADISPEIITVTQYADVEKIYEKDYENGGDSFVNANCWTFVYVRVKNNSSERVNNVFVTLSNYCNMDTKEYREGIFQTIGGEAYAYIDTIEPNQCAVTRQPFIFAFNAHGLDLYARACAGGVEYPCGDDSITETGIQCRARAAKVRNIEGFDVIQNMESKERRCRIKVTIHRADSCNAVTIVNPDLGLNDDIGDTNTILCTVPANYIGYIYYLICNPMCEARSISMIFEYEWED